MSKYTRVAPIIGSFLLGASFLFHGSQAAEVDPNALATQSQAAREACDKYEAEMEKFTHDTKDPSQVSRADFNALLDFLEKFPGTPEPTRQIREYYWGRYLDLDKTDLGPAWSAYDCKPIRFLEGFDRAVGIVKTKKFTKKDRRRVADIALAEVHRQLAGPSTVLNVAVQRSIAETLAEKRLINVSDAIFVALVNLRDQVDVLRQQAVEKYKDANSSGASKFQDLSKSERHKIGKGILFELESSKNLGDRILKFLDRRE